jgi:hypothetical protein
MVFSAPIFLLGVLPIALLLCFLTPLPDRSFTLTFLSCVVGSFIVPKWRLLLGRSRRNLNCYAKMCG